jgi:hypothetical protein
MRSRTTKRFWDCYEDLPPEIRRQARECFKRWQANPRHPALRFKQILPNQAIYSVRISMGWRALGVMEGDTMVWFWIGSHSNYDQLIARL